MESIIPNKLYFRIGEVSDIVGVKPYVLRYWESEFPDIKPSKSKSGQRLYKRRDVETLVKIKELLYEERFTINGARKRLKELGRIDVKDMAVETKVEDDLPELERFEELVEEKEKGEIEEILAATEIPRPPVRVEAKRHVLPPSASLPASLALTPDMHESSKVLIKIRRDLETLLQVVRAR